MIRTRSLFVGLILAVAGAASAQGPAMPSLWYNPALMMDPAVQKELHVSAAVGQKAMQAMMQELMKAGPVAMGALGGKAPTPAQQKDLAAALERMQVTATKDLSASQKARLHEITLQSYGAKAILDPKVSAQVGLNPGQVTRLQSALYKVTAQQTEALKSSMGGKGGFNMEGMKAASAKGKAQSAAILDAILTPSQKSKWKTLQGKHIELGPLGSMMGG